MRYTLVLHVTPSLHTYQCRNGVQRLLEHVNIHDIQFKNITSLEDGGHPTLLIGDQNRGYIVFIQHEQSACNRRRRWAENNILIQAQIQLAKRLLVNR